MAYSFLTEENVFETYKSAKKYTESLTDPFSEYERISRNRPHPSVPKELPKVTDGTAASIVRKAPRRVVQQVPTGVCKGNGWLPLVADDIFRNRILPHANEDYALIQKGWIALERAIGIGYCPSYTPFVQHGEYFCTDLTLPYWGDIFIQAGKKSDLDANYIFMRSWWQKEDIQALIEDQKGLSKDTEKTWDVENLQQILDAITTKDDKSQTPTEKDLKLSTNGAIEMITGFQRGIGSTFLTFNPQKELILRRKKNKDPRGELPIQFLYGDVDGNNPFGRSIMELIGPLQNLIDSDMQMYQFNRALMLAPPLIKRGNYRKSQLVYGPNRIWDLGVDDKNTVEAASIDSTAIANYPSIYGLQKSQLLNLTASPDQSISADVGNPGFSKTPTGIKAQQANVSVDDNYLRKQFEAWFERWAETAINLYFAERSGVEEYELDDDTVKSLETLAKKGEFDLNLLNGNVIRIDYDTDTPALKFEVDASTSKMEDDQKQQEALTGVLTALDQSPVLAQLITQQYPEKVIAVFNRLVSASKVEDPEDLEIDIEEFKQKQQAAMDAAQAQVPPQGPPPQEPPTDQPQLHPQDQEIIARLQQLDIPEPKIQQALAMINSGKFDENQVLAMLSQGVAQ